MASNQKPNQKALGGREKAKSNDKVADELRKVALRNSQEPNIMASNSKPNRKALGEQGKAKSKDKVADELRKVALRNSQKPNIMASNSKPNQKALGEQGKAKSKDQVADKLHKVADEVRLELQIAAHVWEAGNKEKLLLEFKEILEQLRLASEAYARGEE
ncbi:MAG: hypothetical protein Q9161_004174 [Pseudevernia consocians]